MNPRFRVEQNEFTDTLKRLADLSSRTLPDFINSRLLHIGKNARDKTPVASRTSIMAYLGATMTRQSVSKSGKMKRKYSYSPTPAVYGIMQANRRKAGLDPIAREDMDKEAKKFIAAKLRAVGSLRSGWTRGLGILANAVRELINKDGPKVKLPSDASVAKKGFNLSAMLNYRVTVEEGGGRTVDPRVTRALETAFAEENRQMIQKLDEKMNEIGRKAGAI